MGTYYGFWLFEAFRRTLAKIILSPLSRKAFCLVIILLGLLIVSILMNQLWLFLVFFFVIATAGIWVVYSRWIKPILRYKYWETHENNVLEHSQDNHIYFIEELGLNTDELVILRKKIEVEGEVVIADIDQDGFFLSKIGPMLGIQTIKTQDFLPRKRNDLQLVALNEYIGVKKVFSDWKPFLNELEILYTLSGRSNVPTILAVDFDKHAIVISFIPGSVLREELAQRGAKILHRDLDDDQHYQGLSKIEKKRARLQSARTALNSFAGDDLKNQIYSELLKIHGSGVLLNDLKYGNIILEKDSGSPFLIDFDFAQQIYSPNGPIGKVKCDAEIMRFNLIFDVEKPTRRSLVTKIAAMKQTADSISGSSVNFGHGLSVGKTWDISGGEGLWNYLVSPNLPGIQGKRILDLGFLDPLISIRMLLEGAKQVVSIDPEEKVSRYRRFLNEGFEWSNNATLNLEIIDSSLDEIQDLSLGTFDIAITGEYFFRQPRKIIPDLIRILRSVCKMVVVIHGKQFDQASDGHGGLVNDKNISGLLVSNGFQLAGEVIPRWGDNMLTIVQ